MQNFETSEFDFSKLQTTLVNAKLQQTNNPLYQTLNLLIKGTKGLSDRVATQSDIVDLETEVTGVLPPANGGIKNASYFPALVSLANVSAVNVFYAMYTQGDRQVTVYGKLNITPTAAGVLTQLEIEMPIHSNFAGADQLQGLINGIPLGASTVGFAGIIIGNVSNGQARIQFFPQNTDNHDCRYSINYELI